MSLSYEPLPLEEAKKRGLLDHDPDIPEEDFGPDVFRSEAFYSDDGSKEE